MSGRRGWRVGLVTEGGGHGLYLLVSDRFRGDDQCRRVLSMSAGAHTEGPLWSALDTDVMRFATVPTRAEWRRVGPWKRYGPDGSCASGRRCTWHTCRRSPHR